MPSPTSSTRSGLEWAGILIGIAAIAGLTSVILVDLVAMPRIGFALARDGLLPEAFRRIHPTWGTPVLMTSLTVVAVALLAGLVPISVLAEMVSIGTLFAFVVVAIAVIVLRRTQPDMKRLPHAVGADPADRHRRLVRGPHGQPQGRHVAAVPGLARARLRRVLRLRVPPLAAQQVPRG